MRLGALALIFILSACAHRSQKICDNIQLREGNISLTRNERLFVCGGDKGSPGWQEVPLPQAEYHLKVFFQQEGYLSPRFERNRDQLDVWAGPRQTITRFTLTGADGVLDAGKKRQVIGEPLKPAKLDEIEQWAKTELNSKGYACPKVTLTAQAWDGQVFTDLQTGPLQRVASITHVGLEAIDTEALARYQAFEIGHRYDVRETQLTVSRMLSDGLIQSAYFTTTCRDEFVDLKLNGSIGPPRLFRFEVGASTEELPFADVTFKNARVDDRASSYTAILHASPRLQSLTGTSQLYLLPWSKQTYLGPRFRLARESEQAYETLKAEIGADLGRFWDMWNVRFSGRVGPTLNYVETVQGLGPENVSYLSFDGSLSAMSHTYEISVRNQYEGWTANLNYRGQRDGLGSQLNVDRLDFNYKVLWNIGSFIPPLIVVGTRVSLSSIDSEQFNLGTGGDVLPVEYRIFYGGNDNLRGFGRKTLTNGDFGYVTAAYLGVEVRLVEELPYNVQPFLLYDVAQLGASSYDLDAPLFTSPGVGIRWASPFGTIRGSAARGKIYNEDITTANYTQEWVYFVSFGVEF